MSTFSACASAQFSEATVNSLADARRGQRLLVGAVNAPGALGDRLMELGLVPGTEVDVLHRGILGGHLRLAVRGTILPLHPDVARSIEVSLLR